MKQWAEIIKFNKTWYFTWILQFILLKKSKSMKEMELLEILYVVYINGWNLYSVQSYLREYLIFSVNFDLFSPKQTFYPKMTRRKTVGDWLFLHIAPTTYSLVDNTILSIYKYIFCLFFYIKFTKMKARIKIL